MKTLEEIEAEYDCDVYPVKDFIELRKFKFITPYDGTGYFHDGESETDINVWNVTDEEVSKFPYVCWYNK